MKSFTFISAAVAALIPSAMAVTGAAEGFAQGVTGGGKAAPVYPKNIKELASYLSDPSPQVVVLEQEFDFIGTEGTGSEKGCAPWGTGAGCQTAINKDDWCNNYQPDAPQVDVTYDKAGQNPIKVASDKTIIGTGKKGVIKGKGLRISGGAQNIIIQNIHITELNPAYVWGGDAITINGADMVWIDHVTTSLVGRQHIVLGETSSGRVTISNSKIDGTSEFSATCDGHHYWSMYFTGSDDQITFKNNYIVKTSGRAPKVQGGTLLHAVNNVWEGNTGHALELGEGGSVVAEGNVFNGVKAAIEEGFTGKLFSSPDEAANAACSDSLGHACEVNSFVDSGTLDGTDTSVLGEFSGKCATAEPFASAEQVAAAAGFGTI
ncbi:hypothetical protein FZEAL_9821 [Fusarium zealandicum]|uniref:pectin lyase n=1 Tax=Fusarium zealandicum TaxID=1053134 RepID=A0A8H4XDW2_9HYPO|nr:hypothetical protein FZEAL_9821 [Fusarium zealandicum]